ncbi:Gfo/Idh/MocA family protein [Paenibacillus chungangensis]|uniref:Gfo/Idh/MocA family protein n=1 Tax=Paenibacillus chungangensis TaxID=696535 RepID=A0ABW3HNX7_9BACL
MKKVKVALIGAGLRGQNYVSYAHKYPGEMELVAVAESNSDRLAAIQRRYGIDEAMCFSDWRDLLNQPKIADATLICTQDQIHFEPAMRALDGGYHVMLEKPMSPDPLECLQMGNKAEQTNRILAICHVLRYTVFFRTIKNLLKEGAIGQLMSIQHNENVAYWHQAHSYVRGNWRNTSESSPMILSKSSHDLDILLWLAGSDCTRLSSFGTLSHFTAANAPKGGPNRCTDGCPVALDCLYYAPDVYLNGKENWMVQAISDDPSPEARLRALQEGPYGRCVYRCDNDVVDHQVVSMEFANEVTVVFTMSAFTQNCSRTIKLMGTKGEIHGSMETNEIELIRFGGKREQIPLDKTGGLDGHGGGDHGLMRDFLQLVRNGEHESLTSAKNSVQSHLMAFAAEHSRLSRRVIDMQQFSAALSGASN